MSGLAIVLIVVSAIVFGVLGFIIGNIYRKKVAESKIGSANEEALRIVNQAVQTAESKKKESILEAKDEIHKLRSEADKEIRERRAEVQRQEKRIDQKEEALDKRSANIEKKEETLSEKVKLADEKLEELDKLKKSQLDMLEKVSGFTKEEAKAMIISELEESLVHEKALKVREYEQQLKDDSDNLAREIITSAIQRCAADHTSEVTVTAVTLPNDDMKGRIIGREGRNIRTIEQITGVDLIIDDTPETITVSSFDPVRREVARLTLEKLIQDGRIHPARIEEMFEKSKREVEKEIKINGERAALDAGVNGLHPEIIKLLGKLKYRTSYGQNVLNHSLEVSYLCGLMADEVGADVKLAKRAGLLHDIGKALDREFEGTHIELGVEVAKKYKERDDVVHAIAAHHGDIEAKTVVAVLVQAADAVSAARPGARRENIQNYIKRLEKLEEIATSFDGIEKSFAIQAGREIRIMVDPAKVSDEKMVLVAHDIAKKIEDELEYPGQIKVHIVRENRAVDFAK
ncbi:MAG: ribonuclease Y [Clostridiales bacterium]|nr:ribonuclease Y [Clostridiales bacterium]